MSTIQSRTPEKKAKNHVTLTRKLPGKSCCTSHLPFLSSYPKILNAFVKIFPTKMKPTKCPATEKKKGKKSEKRGEKRKRKVKSQDCCVTCRPFLRMPELRKLMFCISVDQKAAKCTTCKRLCGTF